MPGINISGNIVNNLRYADDTVLIADNEQDLQNIRVPRYTTPSATAMRLQCMHYEGRPGSGLTPGPYSMDREENKSICP